jgi:hypothetical protein
VSESIETHYDFLLDGICVCREFAVDSALHKRFLWRVEGPRSPLAFLFAKIEGIATIAHWRASQAG